MIRLDFIDIPIVYEMLIIKMEVHDVLPVSHNPPAGPLFDLSIELVI